MRETLSKHERLTRRKEIQLLFTSGSSLTASPLKARWLYSSIPAASPVQIMIAVPKSAFPDATDRNLIRRRIRESFRKNKSRLYESLMHSGRRISLVIIYSGGKILPYAGIEEKIIVLLQRLIKEHENASG